MANQRSTKAEYSSRCEEAADLLAAGHPGRSVVKKLTIKYSVSSRQAREYVRDGQRLTAESVPVFDRAFLFAQTFAGLQADRLDAKDLGNINAQVGASKQLVQMLKLIPEIDPMRDFETAFMHAAAPYTKTNLGPVPRIKISTQKREEPPF